MPLEYASAGGEGGVWGRRSDMVLERKAIKGGYNLSPEQRAAIVERAFAILQSKPEEITDNDGNVLGVSFRDQLSAAKVLLAADKMDLEAAKMATETPEQHLHLHGGPAQMFQDVINAIRERDAIPAQRIEPAAAEPAGDDK